MPTVATALQTGVAGTRSAAVTEMLTEMKKTDFDIALNIAGYAGLPIRDRLGKVNDEVWTQSSTDSTTGRLVEPSDVRKLLLTQINAQLESKKELLAKLETNDLVCKWVLKYTTTWEKAYNEGAHTRWDMGDKVASIMHEALHEVLEIVNSGPFPVASIYKALKAAKQRNPDLPLLAGELAVVRFLFRNEYTRHYMCRIAGKLLQKKETCNKAGAYSARQQRNDITFEKDCAVKALLYAIDDQEERLNEVADMLADRGADKYFADHSDQEGCGQPGSSA